MCVCVSVCERGGGGVCVRAVVKVGLGLGVKIYPSNPKHTRAGI